MNQMGLGLGGVGECRVKGGGDYFFIFLHTPGTDLTRDKAKSAQSNTELKSSYKNKFSIHNI